MAELKKGWKEPHYTGRPSPVRKPPRPPLPPVGQGRCFAPRCTTPIPYGEVWCSRHWNRLNTETIVELKRKARRYAEGRIPLEQLRVAQLRARMFLGKLERTTE